MHAKRYARVSIGNERGMVLVVGLLLIVVLVLLGTTAVMTSTTDMKISANYKTSTQAFYIAEAGIEHARENVRQAINLGSSLSQILAARVGGTGVLSDSSTITNFYANGTFVTDDVPFIASTSYGAGSYRVYLTNDAADGVTSVTDMNYQVTLTSFGFGPNNSFTVTQVSIRMIVPPNLPAPITLPGPNPVFDGPNSNVADVADGTKPAICVDNLDAKVSVQAGIPANRYDNYQGNCPSTPCIEAQTIPSPWGNKADLLKLYADLKAAADFTSPSDTGFTLGTTSNRRIVVIDGGYSYTGAGAGILVVTDELVLQGKFDYDGIIIAVGNGRVIRKGAGSGTITGGIVVANTNTPGTELGIPYMSTDGGGSSDIQTPPGGGAPPNVAPLKKVLWKQF